MDTQYNITSKHRPAEKKRRKTIKRIPWHQKPAGGGGSCGTAPGLEKHREAVGRQLLQDELRSVHEPPLPLVRGGVEALQLRHVRQGKLPCGRATQGKNPHTRIYIIIKPPPGISHKKPNNTPPSGALSSNVVSFFCHLPGHKNCQFCCKTNFCTKRPGILTGGS